MADKQEVIFTNIFSCARCGNNHHDLAFQKLTNPVHLEGGDTIATHWAPCPTNGEPILLVVVQEIREGRY